MRTNRLAALVLLPVLAFWPHRKPAPPPPAIPSVPYIDHRVLLMEELYDDTEVCAVEHAYTNKVIRQCAPIAHVRAYLRGFLPADDAP